MSPYLQDADRGKFEDRGKASFTNSPTTPEMAREFISKVIAANISTMVLDNINVNVCRDNFTAGVNFLNMPNIQRISHGSYTPSELGSILVSEAPEVGQNLAQWASSYPFFGGEPGRAIANYDAINDNGLFGFTWSKMVYGESTSDDDYLDDLLGGDNAHDSLTTMISMDKDNSNHYSTISVLNLSHDSTSFHDDKLFVSVMPLRSIYEGNDRYFAQVNNPSYLYPWGYNFGIGDDPGEDYITKINIGTEGTDYASVPWEIYSETIQDFSDLSLSRFSSGDREIILRNNDLVNIDLTSGSDSDWVDLRDARYFMPIMPKNDHGQLTSDNLLDNVSHSGLAAWMTDGAVGTWAIPDSWDSNGWWTGSLSTTIADITFTDPQDVSGILLYVRKPNPLRLAQVVLEDDEGEVIYKWVYNLPAPLRVGGDANDSSTQALIRHPQPMWMSLPDEICQDVKQIKVFPIRTWKGEPSNNNGGLWCEIKVFGQGSWSSGHGKPEIYLPQNVEFIERLPETDTDSDTTNFIDTSNIEYTIIANGDETYWSDKSRYVSTSNQGAMFILSVGYNTQGSYFGQSKDITSMRWNFGYNLPVISVCGFPSRQDKSDADASEWETFLTMLIFFIVLIGLIILGAVLSGGTGTVALIVSVWGLIQFGVFVMDFVTPQSNIREDLSEDKGLYGVGTRLLWDWIIDTEGTVARIISGQKYNVINADWDNGRWWRIQYSGDINLFW
ncbi:MAG: hypothetical protein ACFFB5_06350 [Promethearchaeota archaeon]